MITLDLKLVLFGLLLLCGLLVLATVVFMNQSERRRRHWAVLTALQPVLSHAPLAAVVLDQQGHLHYANPTAARLLGIDPAMQALPESDWSTQLRADLQALQRTDTQAGRYRIVQLAGTSSTGAQPLTVRWWVTRWHEWVLLFVTDITAQQRAEQSAHLLLSDLAHELRTPLATLLTHLEVLSLSTLTPELRNQSTAFMKAEVQRLVRLSNNLVELGRLEAKATLAVQTVDLLALVESVAAQVRPAIAESQMQLTVTAEGLLAPVLGDPDRLRQLFLNLLDNAMKYGVPGNQITLALQSQPQGVACAVCDTGPGIPAAHLPHLTRRFYRAAPAGVAGSGLGLALVAEILRQHQSQLSIESHTEGTATGTCVRFTLPVALSSNTFMKGDKTTWTH